MSKIIHARVVEIIEQVFNEIKEYGHDDPRNKLIAGIVLTGGGSQLKHIKQLVEYITGMDTRIGYPNEHLAGNSDEEISCPLYATVVGLVMNSIENKTQSALKLEKITETKVVRPPVIDTIEEEIITEDIQETKTPIMTTSSKRNFFDLSNYLGKIKEFLDNAE